MWNKIAQFTVVIGSLIAFSPASMAGELLLTNREGTRPPEQESFFEHLADTFKKSFGSAVKEIPSINKLNAGWMFSDQADLNGDGVVELFVYPDGTTYACGNIYECTINIYQKQPTGWTHIGEITGLPAHPLMGQTVKVEHTLYNGWRTIAYGDQRACYYKPPPDKSIEPEKDILGMPIDYQKGGYYWWSPGDKPCSEGKPISAVTPR